jgi:hypothetical protein
MKIWILKGVIILCCLNMALGCATIIHGTAQDIQINTSPEDAEVWIDGSNRGTTPSKITLSRKNDYYVIVKKEGFEESSTKIRRETSGWLLGNIIFGGLIGCAIDFSSGGAYDLHPKNLDIILTESEQLNDSLNSPTNVAAAKTKYEMPASLKLELEHNNSKTLFDGKISLTYKDFAWRESVIMGTGILGFSESREEPFSRTSLNISEKDVFYMQVDSKTVYEIAVTREQDKKLYLELKQLHNPGME